jgi:hypothetical protein
VTEFYGIQMGAIPGFAEAGGGKFMSVQGLPDRTVQNMVKFMDRLRGMHAQDPLAFEVCLRHVASMIEDQRRSESHTDPRDGRASLSAATASSATAGWPVTVASVPVSRASASPTVRSLAVGSGSGRCAWTW